jgi:hypothetical protein
MVKEKRQWIEKKLRLEPHEARLIEDCAHAARLPLAVYMRNMLVTGLPPKVAPPAAEEVSYGCAVLTSTVNGLISNLSQIEQHSILLGEPLSRLAGSKGTLQRLKKEALQIGLVNKLGGLTELEIKQILKLLQPASQSLNDDLAKPLNQGIVAPNGNWRILLENLQSALAVGFCDVKKS